MLRLAVLASGGGTNLQNILDAGEKGDLGLLKPVLVVVDRPCNALDRGTASGLETVYLDRFQYGEKLSSVLSGILEEQHIEVVALAGWLSILDSGLIRKWEGRIVNIHPSLLPRHGGSGMYGHHVHQAVLDAGERVSGCTVHLVTELVDEGLILGQSEVPVIEGDTSETLAARVLVAEHRLYPEVLSGFTLEEPVESE